MFCGAKKTGMLNIVLLFITFAGLLPNKIGYGFQSEGVYYGYASRRAEQVKRQIRNIL